MVSAIVRELPKSAGEGRRFHRRRSARIVMEHLRQGLDDVAYGPLSPRSIATFREAKDF